MAKNNPDPLDTPSSFQVPSATGFSSPVAVLGTTHFTQLPISDSQTKEARMGKFGYGEKIITSKIIKEQNEV